MWILVLQRLVGEAILDIIYFPLWWYTAGAWKALRWCFGLFEKGNGVLAPGLWFINIFVPMYGQFDWQGRLISFLMRSVQIIARSFALLVWAMFCLILFFIWLIIPILIAAGLIHAIRVTK